MKEQLEQTIKDIVKELYDIEKDVILTVPPQKGMGDFATNIALSVSKELGMTPQEIAKDVILSLSKDKFIQKAEVAGPGFINLYINKSFFFDNLLSIDENYGKINLENSQKIIVEYGHPNTHKLPHIGHLYSYVIGSSLSRILRNAGNEIIEVNYQGDVGPHVAKCIYAWIQKGRPVPETLIEKVRLLQICYQEGSEMYESPEHKEKIQQINKDIYNPNSDIQKDWEVTRQWSLDYYLAFENNLGVNQTKHYLESQVWELGLNKVKENIGKIFKESEGAVIFEGENYGFHNRVFITQNGTPTYEAKEVGLAMKKSEDWNFDLNITPTAREQNGYFDVTLEAIQQLFPDLRNKLKHIGFGMVSLSTGKMSSRKGNILSATDLIEEITIKIREIIETRENLKTAEKEDIVNKVALGSIRYAFLKSNILKDMKFDIEESISFEGNSGPYLQYVYARIMSVLRDQKDILIVENISEICNKEEEIDLVIKLSQYPNIVKEAVKTLSPHLISTYLFDLAQTFNKFYNSVSINSADSEDLIAARRVISEKTALTMKLGLNLLGIETVEKM